MKIYCYNYECQFNQLLDVPYSFPFRKHHYVPLGEDKVRGKCLKRWVFVDLINKETRNVCYRLAFCEVGDLSSVLAMDETKGNSTEIICNCYDCLWNDQKKEIEGKCFREEILVDEVKVGVDSFWACKCFSQIKFKGHIDLGRFPSGGQLSDDYGKKDKWI